VSRHQSVDPIFIQQNRLADPQQINLYSYARNNPMKYIDPTGRDITAEGDSQDDYLKWLQSKLSFNIKLEQNPNGTSTVALGDNQMAKEQIMGSLEGAELNQDK